MARPKDEFCPVRDAGRRPHRAHPPGIRHQPNGKYQARYLGPDKLRHCRVFETVRDAEAWLGQARADMSKGIWTPPELEGVDAAPDLLTFERYARSWIARRELAAWTRVRYESLLAKHILPEFGSKPLAEVSFESVQAWYSKLLVNHPTTRAHSYALLRAIFRTAVRERVIRETPVDIEHAGTVKRKHQVTIATLDELTAIVKAMPERLRLSVLLAAWCSLRYGEVAELRRSDLLITDEGYMVNVTRGVTWPESATKPLVGSPKTQAGVRPVAVPPHLAPAIRDHLATYTQWGRDGLLFPAGDGEQIHPANYHKHWSKAREAAGRPDLHFHDLRHTGATMAAQMGATLAELMSRLGHTTPAAALIYQHAAGDRDKAIASKLSEMATGTSWS